MTKKMLIDATHPEETRVTVVDGNKLEDFDFESAARQQLSGNIYLAKVTRIEPSLQAAFVEYGGNRHGFLAFNEIHPDYYQIPVADRQALLEEDAAEEQRAQDADEDVDDDEDPLDETDAEFDSADDDDVSADAQIEGEPEDGDADEIDGNDNETDETDTRADTDTDDAEPSAADADTVAPGEDRNIPLAAAADTIHSDPVAAESDESAEPIPASEATPSQANDDGEPAREDGDAISAETTDQAEAPDQAEAAGQAETVEKADASGEVESEPASGSERRRSRGNRRGRRDNSRGKQSRSKPGVESVGGEDAFDEISRPRSSRRRYKIQEVIKKRQILLVQVLKDERGTKGAALTTYLSIAGRYCVLMPNTARGGGISRKITNAVDRKRLKAVATDLDVPEGMGLIVRTAGANRTKAEIKRDFEYLLRQWEDIRETTLRSTAPALINEEGSLIKRAIRDQYDKDIEMILVEGEDGYREAKGFMRMLMPSHAKKVQPHRDPIPLFQRYQIEPQLDSMFDPTVRLKSGGYIVIDPTEALVSIDVNSGKATRESNIEATALRTNTEAAEEVARQLRLRDLAGLIVIDFIDMENNRNNRAVEKKIKDCLKTDRARIQVGRISAFGLLEMSRQRLRQGVVETTTSPCPHCSGTGLIRSVESLALHILRGVEEEASRKRHQAFDVNTPSEVAIYILNQKRDWLEQIEARSGVSIYIIADADMRAPNYEVKPARRNVPAHAQAAAMTAPLVTEEPPHQEERTDEQKTRKPRRRRSKADGGAETDAAGPTNANGSEQQEDASGEGEAPPKKRRSRRSRRGGRGRESAGTVSLADKEASPAADGSEAPDNVADNIADNVVSIPISTGAEPERESAPQPTTGQPGTEDQAVSEAMPDVVPDADEKPTQPADGAFTDSAADTDATAGESEPAATEAKTEPEETAAEQPEPVSETAVAEPEPEPEPAADKPAEPKRGGWWQRRFGGA